MKMKRNLFQNLFKVLKEDKEFAKIFKSMVSKDRKRIVLPLNYGLTEEELQALRKGD